MGSLSIRPQNVNFGKTAAKYSIERKQARMIEYARNPKICKQCQGPIPYDKQINQFCKSSCSATYNNTKRGPKTEETKKNISKALMGRTNADKGIPPRGFMMVTINCLNCDEPFETRLHDGHKETCSDACFTEWRSKVGRKSAEIRGLRSLDEIRLYELCEGYFNNLEHNKRQDCGWDADIIIADLKWAIMWDGFRHREPSPDGRYTLQYIQDRDARKIKAFEDYGWTVFVFPDNQYTPESAFEELKIQYSLLKI